jgi:hypothetical protein
MAPVTTPRALILKLDYASLGPGDLWLRLLALLVQLGAQSSADGVLDILGQPHVAVVALDSSLDGLREDVWLLAVVTALVSSGACPVSC